jgi:hypothetical protein
MSGYNWGTAIPVLYSARLLTFLCIVIVIKAGRVVLPDIENETEEIMLTNITWGNYLIGLAVILFLYYSYVILRYYRTELIAFINRGPADSDFAVAKEAPAEDQDNKVKELHQQELYHKVEEFAQRLKNVVANVYHDTLQKTELIAAIQPLFREFYQLKNTAYAGALEELLLSECSKYGAVLISEDDLDEVWG